MFSDFLVEVAYLPLASALMPLMSMVLVVTVVLLLISEK